MYHPLLMQPEVLRDLPALLDDLRPRSPELAVLTYRSEAFAEDLAEPAVPAPPTRKALLLGLVPMALAMLGTVLTGRG